ncbi:holin [Embleya sp. NPDC020630]|uniref:holin n=1 Tax=Embleya sp. NPDC020630 TaxID=3363979 RepID=UPI0037AA502E
MTTKGKFFLDLFERATFTYLETLLGLLIATGTDVLDLTTAKVAAVAAIPAGLAVVKAGLASMVGTPGTASVLPTGSEPTR